jgi:hypothetical protein
MKTSISLTLAAICAWQVASANAGDSNLKNGNAVSSKPPSINQPTSYQPIYILVPVNSGQLSNIMMNQGQSNGAPYPTTGIILGQGKGTVDPGYFGGTSNPPIKVTHGGNPPRQVPPSTITHGGNPPRAPRAPANYNNGRNYNYCNNGWYYYNNAWYYSNQWQPSYSAEVTITYDNDDIEDNSPSYNGVYENNYSDYGNDGGSYDSDDGDDG